MRIWLFTPSWLSAKCDKQMLLSDDDGGISLISPKNDEMQNLVVYNI